MTGRLRVIDRLCMFAVLALFSVTAMACSRWASESFSAAYAGNGPILPVLPFGVVGIEQKPDRPPEPGLVVQGKVVRVVDGDTLRVAVTWEIPVRIKDCWASESKADPRIPESQREKEKQKGLAAAKYLESMVSGKTVRLQIVPQDSQFPMSATTLGRVIADVWVEVGGNFEDVAARMVAAGHATKTKLEVLK